MSVTETEHRAKQADGRAFLKPADYEASPEVPSDDYPLLLNTGRTIYHFHTRTKTGRAPALQAAAPDVFVQIAEVDAAQLGVAEGDRVEVTSRRGAVVGPARIGDVEPGHLFVPFHYGYWDAEGHERAANEMTLTAWDPVSKQPHFKYAAVRVRKV